MTPRVWVWSVVALAGACADAAPDDEATPPVAPPGPTVSIEDEPVTEAARAVAEASELPIAIDPAASEVASCARVTLVTPTATEADALVRLFGDALSGSGLMVERTRDGAIVRRVAGAPPPAGCADPVVAEGETEPTDSPSTTTGGRTSSTSMAGTSMTAGGSTTAEPTPDRGQDAVDDGIRAVGPNQYEVSREAIDAVVADPTRLGGGRITPVIEDGRTSGMRVSGLRSTSAGYRMGVRNGDIIRSVNGQALDNPAAALMALSNVQQQGRATIVLDRNGQARTLQWRTVD